MGREGDDWNGLMGEWAYSLEIWMRVHVNAGAFIGSLNGFWLWYSRDTVCNALLKMVALQCAYRMEEWSDGVYSGCYAKVTSILVVLSNHNKSHVYSIHYSFACWHHTSIYLHIPYTSIKHNVFSLFIEVMDGMTLILITLFVCFIPLLPPLSPPDALLPIISLNVSSVATS